MVHHPLKERERESESNRGECLWREWVSGHMMGGCQMVWSIYTSNESIPVFFTVDEIITK